MMKKVLATILIVGALVCVNYYEHNYTRKDCKVVQINDGIATFEDQCGFYWDWKIEENEYFEVGDYVDLKMYDNFSSAYVGDDEITEIVFQD